MHRDGHRHRVVCGVALGLQTAVLRDAIAVAVHRDDKAVKVCKTAHGTDRQPDLALCAAIYRQVLPYRHGADRVAAVSVGKDSDGIRCKQNVITCITVVQRQHHSIPLQNGIRPGNCNICRRIKQVALGINIGHLAQETVERFLSIRECGGDIKPVLRHCHILVDIDRAVGPLVPHLAGRAPRPGHLASIYSHPTVRIARRPIIIRSCDNNLRMTVRIDIRHHRIFRHGARICRNGRIQIIQCDSIHNKQLLRAPIDYLVASVLIEVKNRETRSFPKRRMITHHSHG